jgi:hypothetical protein
MPRYPTPENVEIRPQARTFILFALTLAYPMFGAGFELGAYGELIYERKITAWAVVTAVWLGFGLVPREQTGIRNWQLLALAIPCLWLLAAGFCCSRSGWCRISCVSRSRSTWWSRSSTPNC